MTDRENTRVQYGLLALPLVVILIIGAIVLIHRSGGSSSNVSTAPLVGQSPPATLPTVAAATYARQVEQAIHGQAGVRVELTATDEGVPFRVIGEAGRDSGVQVAQIGSQTIEGRYVAGVMYFLGSAAVLQSIAGFPASVAARADGRWVAVHRGEPDFRSDIQGMTTQYLYPAKLGLVGPLKLVGPKMQAGVESIGVSGHDFGAHSVPETVWVNADGSQLPVVDIADGSTAHGHIHERSVFSRWGVPVHVVAPPNAVSYASLS